MSNPFSQHLEESQTRIDGTSFTDAIKALTGQNQSPQPRIDPTAFVVTQGGQIAPVQAPPSFPTTGSSAVKD